MKDKRKLPTIGIVGKQLRPLKNAVVVKQSENVSFDIPDELKGNQIIKPSFEKQLLAELRSYRQPKHKATKKKYKYKKR